MERGVLPQRFDVHGADCVSASFLVVVTGTGVAHLLVHALSVQLFDFSHVLPEGRGSECLERISEAGT